MTKFSYPVLGSRVGGRKLESTNTNLAVENPATGEILGMLPLVDLSCVQLASSTAGEAFKEWKEVSPIDRSRILKRTAQIIDQRKQELAWLITLELGKPLSESYREVQTVIELFEWSAEEARRAYGRVIPGRNSDTLQYTVYEPVGPVAAFSGWNAPAITPTRKISGALAAGCSVVIKPSEATPACALFIADVLTEAGLPDGVLNVIFGDAEMVSSWLLEDDIIKMFTFTGSTYVGKKLAQKGAFGLKRMTLELGGYASAIVMPDVNLEVVVDSAVSAAYRNSGQVCTSPSRFLVHDSIYSDFVDMFCDRISSMKVGNGLDADTIMGPVANEHALKHMESLVADAMANGIRIVGGKRVDSSGHFFEPTLLVGITDNCLAACEEPFGPVKSISSFCNIDQAIKTANRLPFGLAGYLWTNDSKVVSHASKRLQVGALAINQWTVSLPETPFGGIRNSGMGLEGGIEGIKEFMQTKFVAHGF